MRTLSYFQIATNEIFQYILAIAKWIDLQKTHLHLVKMQKMNIWKNIRKQVTREFVYFWFQSGVLILLIHKSVEYGLKTWFVQNNDFRVMALDLQHTCTTNVPEIWLAQNVEIRVFTVDVCHICAVCRLETWLTRTEGTRYY